MVLNIFYFILCSFLASVFCHFEMCNHKVQMKAGEKLYVNSPYYPAEYPIGSSCRYAIKAPQDYKLKFTCNIKLNTPSSAIRCQNEIFYFNPEGSDISTGSEYFCGTGKMKRKSFLNQAVLSYISTPYYKRILTNSITEAEEDIQNNKIKKTQIEVQKKQQKTRTTTVKALTNSEALKKNQLPTIIAIKTTTNAPIAMTSNLSPSFAQPLCSAISSPISSALEEKNMKLMNNRHENKKVSNNSFAYVVTLLSNKIDKEAFATTTSATTKSLATANKRTTKSTSSIPTSVSNFIEYLPVNTWLNDSIATHKISTKHVAQAIAGQDYTTSQLATASHSHSTSSSTTLVKHNTRSNEAGGSFSCLVEVLEPQCECGWSSSVKIAGASGVAGINEFPAMTGIMTIKNQKIFCGATIIHHRYLLSAAHCYITSETNTPEYLTAVVGEHDLSTVLDSPYTRQYDLIKIMVHEYFQASAIKVHNDIALLKTRISIEWNRSVGPVCLPFYALRERKGTSPYAGQRLETAGWGTTSFGGQQSSLLLKTTLDVISRSACQNLIGFIPFGEFCTYTPERDTCQYDSGGALYAREDRLYAVGIVSYGYACATKQPSINTRISSYLHWIRNHTPEVKYCTK